LIIWGDRGHLSSSLWEEESEMKPKMIVLLILLLLFSLAPLNMLLRGSTDNGSFLNIGGDNSISKRSSNDGRTVFVGEGNDPEWICSSKNIIESSKGYLKLNDKMMNRTHAISADGLSTFSMINARMVEKYQGEIFLSFIRTTTTPSPVIKFYLTMSDDEGRTWKDPVEVFQRKGNDEGGCELEIHDEKIFFLIVLKGQFSYQRELSVKVTSIMNWQNISSVQRYILDDVYSTVSTKMCPVEEKLILFWWNSNNALRHITYDGGKWVDRKLIGNSIAAFSPVRSAFDGNPRIFLIYTYSDRNTIYMKKTADGTAWSNEIQVGYSNEKIRHISGTDGGSEIHLALSFDEIERIGYGKLDNTETMDLKFISEYSMNLIDPESKEVMVSYSKGEVIICYENSSGRVEFLISVDGYQSSRRITIGNGIAHSPSMDRDFNVICYMNGTRLEIWHLERAIHGSLLTRTIAPFGLHEWKDFGFSASGLVDGAGIEFRIWNNDLSEQLFPDEGTIDINTLNEKIIEGKYYRYGGILAGPWTMDPDLVSSIVLEINIYRAAGLDPFLFSLSMNYTTGIPYHEDFTNIEHIAGMDGCIITEIGLELEASRYEGWAILGPYERENDFPDHLSSYCSFLGNGNSIKFSLLDMTSREIQNYETHRSSQIETNGQEIYVNWQGTNFGDLELTYTSIFIKIELFRGSGEVPVVNWIRFSFSEPPSVIGGELVQTWVLRGDQTKIVLAVDDIEDPARYLSPEIQYLEPGSDTWSSYLISGPLYIDGQWCFNIRTDHYMTTGIYEFRARVIDTCSLASDWFEMDIDLEVRNNLPSPPLISIEPGDPTVNDVIDIRMVREGQDKECSQEDLRYNLYLFRNGVFEREYSNLSDPSMTIDDLDLVRGDIWTFEIKSWDGENESGTSTYRIDVVNSAPKGSLNLPSRISFMEDEIHIEDRISNWFTDDDGDRITYVVTSSPQLSVTMDNDRMVIVPDSDYHGEGFIAIEGSDGDEKFKGNISVLIDPVNDAPIFNPIARASVKQGEWVYVDIGAQDFRDNEDVEVVADIIMKVPGVELGTNIFFYPNGSFKLNASNEMIGLHNISFSIYDSHYNLEHNINLEIINVNDPPIIDQVRTRNDRYIFLKGEEIRLEAKGADPDLIWGDVLKFEWIVDNEEYLGTGESIILDLNEGTHSIDLILSDYEGSSDTSTIQITVIEEEGVKGMPLRTWLLFIISGSISLLLSFAIISVLFMKIRRKGKDSIDEDENIAGERTPASSPVVTRAKMFTPELGPASPVAKRQELPPYESDRKDHPPSIDDGRKELEQDVKDLDTTSPYERQPVIENSIPGGSSDEAN
jgi:hypothetical protein